jgi:uncharacterized damage-inducible protein DinB
VGALVAMLDYACNTTLTAIDGLSTAQLEHRHDEKANSIGAMLAHVASTEWYYLTATLEHGAADPAAWSDWGVAMRLGPPAEAAAKGRDALWHRERLASLRSRTLAGLRGVDDAWLAGEFTLPWLGQSATHHWAWFHVAEDELNHRGQIRWLRARLSAV